MCGGVVNMWQVKRTFYSTDSMDPSVLQKYIYFEATLLVYQVSVFDSPYTQFYSSDILLTNINA